MLCYEHFVTFRHTYNIIKYSPTLPYFFISHICFMYVPYVCSCLGTPVRYVCYALICYERHESPSSTAPSATPTVSMSTLSYIHTYLSYSHFSCAAVLAHQYATRHGYDYLQLAAISTVGLVSRVHQVTDSPWACSYILTPHFPMFLFISSHITRSLT